MIKKFQHTNMQTFEQITYWANIIHILQAYPHVICEMQSRLRMNLLSLIWEKKFLLKHYGFQSDCSNLGRKFSIKE